MYTCRGIYLHIQLESESMQMRLTNTEKNTSIHNSYSSPAIWKVHLSQRSCQSTIIAVKTMKHTNEIQKPNTESNSILNSVQDKKTWKIS